MMDWLRNVAYCLRKVAFALALVSGSVWILPAQVAKGQVNKSPAVGQRAKTKHLAASNSGERYVYFFDLAGHYEKVDVSTGIEVAHGQIAAARELTDQVANFDGCIVCAVRYGPETHRLYAVLANSPRLAADGSNSYRIVSLSDADLNQVAATSENLPAAPNILVTSDGSQLLASYQINSPEQKQSETSFALQIYDLPELKLAKTLHESTKTDAMASGAQVNIAFSHGAYPWTGGEIVDHFDVISRNGEEFRKSTLNPYELLARVSDGSLMGYRQKGASEGQGFYSVDFADSEAGKILVTLNAGKSGPQGAVVIDALTHTLSSPIALAGVTVNTVQLTPDAKRVLMEQFTWEKPEGAASPDMNWTGKFFVFDSRNGKQLLTISAEELKGRKITFLGMNGDGNAVYFAKQGELYLLNIDSRHARKIATHGDFKFDGWTTIAPVK